jgi:hypothetical protein
MKSFHLLLLRVLVKSIVLPPLLTLLAFQLIPCPWYLQPLIYLVSLPALFLLRTYLHSLRSNLAARKLGARPVPKVTGRWPLNIDILLDWARSGSEEEVGRMMFLLERTYGETYNTRVLGEDQVSAV